MIDNFEPHLAFRTVLYDLRQIKFHLKYALHIIIKDGRLSMQRNTRNNTSETCSRWYIKDMLAVVHQRHARDCTSNEKPRPISLFQNLRCQSNCISCLQVQELDIIKSFFCNTIHYTIIQIMIYYIYIIYIIYILQTCLTLNLF